jgi:ribosomal protein S18 acetylase RimI-like enzyme
MNFFNGNNVIQANVEHINSIVELFNSNYSNKYHYDKVTSPLKLRYLLNSKNFKGWVVLSKNKKVIGFSGVYTKNKNSLKFVKLAHLLVDEKYRGNGVGELLEEAREQYYANLKESKIVIVSCVENPIYSVELKRKRGFNILGIRLFYRPETESSKRTNGIFMGLLNIRNTENDIKNIEEPSNKTKELISLISLNNGIERNFTNTRKNFLCKYKLLLNENLGRAIVIVKYHKDGVSIKRVIEKLQLISFPYMAICIQAQSPGFAEADYELITNKFYPLTYVPHLNAGKDLVEYQFISNLNSIEYNHISKYTKQFLSYIVK